MTSTTFDMGVETALRKFAESLNAPEGYCAEGRQLVHQVVETIKAKSKFRIAKTLPSGSVGKMTYVISPDFDIVLLIVDQFPPFTKVIDDIEDILLLNERHLKIQPGSIHSTRFSVQFCFTNYIKVDLLPAVNATTPQIYSKIRDDPGNSKWYSSSLTEEAVGFMKDQSSFAHSLARLTKFWYKTCYFGDYIGGGSTMMELIAVAATLQEERMNKMSMLRGFVAVIEMIQKIDTLRLAFRKTGGRSWEVVTVEVLNSGVVPVRSNVRESSYIIEPANPCNNFLADLINKKPWVIQKFKEFAGITRKRVDALMARQLVNFYGGVMYLEFPKLFQPLPTVLTEEFRAPPRICISSLETYGSIHCDMKVRKNDLMKNKETKEFIETMQDNLLMTVNAAGRSGLPENAVRIIRAAVNKMLEDSLQGTFVPEPADHESHDVTLTVPCGLFTNCPAVRVSFGW